MGLDFHLTIQIHIGGHLKDYTSDSMDLEIQGARDILDIILQLDVRVKGIKDRILDEHDLTRPYINIYINEVNTRDLDRESSQVKDGDVIYILPSVAGGKGTLPAGEAR